MASNPYVNKVQTADGTVLIDLSQDSVLSAADIVSGKVGHLADGSQVTGTASGGGGGTFDIKFTITYDETTGDPICSCNKTSAEIIAEYEANGYDNMRVTLDDGVFLFAAYVSVEGDLETITNVFISARFFNVSIYDDEFYVTNIAEYPDPQTQEDVITYEHKVYLLTPSE